MGVPRPSLTPAILVGEPVKDFKDDSKAVSPSLGTVALAAVWRSGKHETGVRGTLRATVQRRNAKGWARALACLFSSSLLLSTHSSAPEKSAQETPPAVLVCTWPWAAEFHTCCQISPSKACCCQSGERFNQGVHSYASALCSAGFKKI